MAIPEEHSHCEDHSLTQRNEEKKYPNLSLASAGSQGAKVVVPASWTQSRARKGGCIRGHREQPTR